MKIKINRILYFGYYLKNLNRDLLRKFMVHVENSQGISKSRQWYFILQNSLRYNVSILENYQFNFFQKTHEEKKKWAGTGTLYEFQLEVNPPKFRSILDDKRKFFSCYREFIVHDVLSREDLEVNIDQGKVLLEKNEKVVFKEASGKCGSGILIKSSSEILAEDLKSFMKTNKFDLVEGFIHQHPILNDLSPSAVNTVRIFTNLDDNGKISILGCRIRISVNCSVDNLAAGNLAAPVDEETGIITGPGVYSDITKGSETVHPVTGISIVGFQIPNWPEIIDLVKRASLLHTNNRSVGWDIAVTDNGPGLIEGNHDWCKLVWQLPVNRGLKHLLKN